jgi:short-subunit dehydrogenase
METLVAIGANSAIAKSILPLISTAFKKIILTTRKNSEVQNFDYLDCEYFELDLGNERGCKIFEENVLLKENNALFIINFMGYFGEPSKLNSMDSKLEVDKINNNIIPFLNLIKLSFKMRPGTVIVNFTGAGVGGPNLDITSLGYAISKGAISFLIEAFDKELRSRGLAITGIAPGNFPSRMQQAVVDSTTMNQERKNFAVEVMNSKPDSRKLVTTLLAIRDHPSEFAGRIVSANRDNILDYTSKPLKHHDLGKIRRIDSC